MSIPVEHLGSERQRIPAVLVKVEKTVGLIKYGPKITPVRVPLSELQLAPSAFEPCEENVYSHTELSDTRHTESVIRSFSARDPAEIWLSTEVTTLKKVTFSEHLEGTEQKTEDTSTPASIPLGAWWPGRVLTVQGGFAHVEVAAPLAENGLTDDVSAPLVVPHIVRMGSSVLPYRSTLARVEEVRHPWSGRPLTQSATATTAVGVNEHASQVATKEHSPEPSVLTSPGVLHRHTICIPAYLGRLATSLDSHSALVKFCGAPCLVQCDPEPFLSGVLAKRILADSDSAAVSGRQTPVHGSELEITIPSVTVSADSQASVSPVWPSACVAAQSAVLSPPNIAGTLSPAGVTDPALLLEGLPGANGPLVLLHIWSGSSEAIRRAGLLELAHVRILVFRYHVMRKLSNGEPGELDLADSTDAPTENGDAPVMHCKPISIPIHANPDDPTAGDRVGGMMIGYSAQFRIQPQLIGLAIGYRGATIHEARALPGVRAVDLLHDGIVHVEAETVEACQTVRNLLDFTEAEIPVSPRLASRLIGSKGMNIRKLAASAGVRRAQLLDPLMRKRRQQQQQLNRQHPTASLVDRETVDSDSRSADGDKVDHPAEPSGEHSEGTEEQNGTVPVSDDEKLPPPAFYLLGTRPSVAKMRLLLEFQADNWNELDELEETRRSLFSQLRQSNQPPMKNSSLPPQPLTSDSYPRGSAAGLRGRGRRSSGRGGSMDGGPEHNDANNHPVSHQPSYRGRNRGGLPNGGGRPFAPPSRFNRQSEGGDDGPVNEADVQQNGNASDLPQPKEQDKVNGWNRVTTTRGRGRNRPRNQPVPTA